jgi:hypothetical protein
MTNYSRYARSPRVLRRRHVRLDNIVLLPGDMLPFKETWEKIAGNLPAGSSLIVLPPSESPQRAIYEAVAQSLRALGKPVRLIAPEQCRTSTSIVGDAD